MKISISLIVLFFVLTSCEKPAAKPLVFPNWPPKNQAYTSSQSNNPKSKRTLVVQIRSDKRVPIVLKRSPHHQAAMASHNQASILARPNRPIKMAISPHFVLKGNQLLSKHHIRKPVNLLKIKLGISAKPFTHSEKPYIYEKPAFSPEPELLKLPIKNPIQFSNNHFVPIHTIPAPNLGNYDNHIQHEEALYTPPSFKNPHFKSHEYKVTEDHTNDQTIVDLISGQQKYFAPDPDPSLPTAKIRPATESFNIPSNGKPFPADILNNYLPPQNQALVQSFNTDASVHNFPPEVYGLPVANQPQLQQFLLQQASAGQNAPLSVYNPTYLVTQSKNLYHQHQQQKQLFKPNPITTYGTADLTQEVASDGQIIQSAKDHSNQIHPEFRGPTTVTTTLSPDQDLPSFAALIGGPPQVRFNPIQNDLTTESGFIVSNYFGNAHQNLQSYQEYLNLSQRQRENDQTLENANLELQKQLLEQDAPNPQKSQPISAYEEHQRLLQQHLGEAPLRIFVPDEDYANDLRPNIQKRSDNKSTENRDDHDVEIEEYSDEEYLMEDNKKDYDLEIDSNEKHESKTD